MVERLQRFIAEDLWLLILILTFGLTGLAGMAGLGVLAGAIAIVGVVLLAPILFIWGEDISQIVVSDESSPSPKFSPINALKHQYAIGEIDENEFDRRLDRLLEVDHISSSESRGEITTENADIEKSEESVVHPEN